MNTTHRAAGFLDKKAIRRYMTDNRAHIEAGFWEVVCLIGFAILLYGIGLMIPPAVPILGGAALCRIGYYRYAALKKERA